MGGKKKHLRLLLRDLAAVVKTAVASAAADGFEGAAVAAATYNTAPAVAAAADLDASLGTFFSLDEGP